MLLFLAACTQPTSGRVPPKVIDGTIDLSTWDFERDGPVPLEGEWLAAPERSESEPSAVPPIAFTDLLDVPFFSESPGSRSGTRFATDAWIYLRVTVLRPTNLEPFAVAFLDWPSPTFRVTCVSDLGVRSGFGDGLWSPGQRSRIASSWPQAALVSSGTTTCTGMIPRGDDRRLRWLSPGTLSTVASLVRYREATLTTVNLAMTVSALLLALAFAAFERQGRAALWLCACLGAYALRLVGRAKFQLFVPAPPPALAEWMGFRLEYLGLWLAGTFAPWYARALANGSAHYCRITSALLLPFVVASLTLSYGANKEFLPLGEAIFILAIAESLRLLWLARGDRAVRLSLCGLTVVLAAALGNITYNALTSRNVAAFEGLALAEPILQVAVLALRAFDARRRSAALVVATDKFVPREFLHALGHDDVTTVALGDASARELTIVFADLRGFTSRSEGMTPEETFAFLNGCLSQIGPHVRAHGGFVDKYIGDAIMALFPRTPDDALRAAVAMQRALRASSASVDTRAPVALGIGIHVGRVMMGTIGEAERFEATVISDAVNLTARLESLTKQLGCSVILSEDVHATLETAQREDVRRLGTFVVKGKAQPVTLYEAFASDHDELREAKRRSRPRFDAMLDAFALGRVDEALAVASELRDATPEDGPASWWFVRLVRAAGEGDDGVPSSRGVVRLDDK